MDGMFALMSVAGGGLPLLAAALLAAEEPGPLGALGIDGRMLIAQIVNFAILLGLLWAFLYRPVLRMLQERRERIAESMRRAEEVKQQLARAQQEYEAALLRARREAQGIIAQANELGKRLTDEARQRAQAEAQVDLDRARAQIRLETQQAIAKLRSEVADLAVLAAGRIIQRSLDTRQHYDLVADVLRETEKLKVE
ncbi:MAG: F0F1 ATP synthase subunit B [Chloroflexi bacterium]|nr:F0F1 ATP synthase subunit B [Chloroflexota bacterium]